ncbi:prenyltransferase/squalene oxidase repeat-containing protein [Candidatus Uabimicrobium sp. HlEnr_7]|uniref:prenyltransferase/squalene oxidase repeat-containing protein n=1 Tax=Candidatus Uabimicrobium helgolandensis TaxID=3095367 RepID=UPI003557E947
MSLRLEMLQVARLAQKPLQEVKSLILHFLYDHLNEDGGFKDRSGNSDLYYSVFALECIHALQGDIPRQNMQKYLLSFSELQKLDFVHLSCLVRAAAAVEIQNDLDGERILELMKEYQAVDGGFNVTKEQQYGSAYANFLLVGTYQDLNVEIASEVQSAIVSNLESLVADDGGYANIPEMKEGNVTATAAAILVLRSWDIPLGNHLGMWLMNHCIQGGFCNSLAFPVPDLLSTATALHALAYLKTDTKAITEPGLDFVDSLWTNRGGFYGNWTDDILDCEYTFYGLLALGHLTL